MRVFLLCTALMLGSSGASATVYRCTGESGAVEFSDKPCASDAKAVDRAARDEVKRSEEAARLQKERDHALTERIQRQKEEARKHTEERKLQAERERERNQPPTPKSTSALGKSTTRPLKSDAVNCTDLLLYMKSKGHGWMERVSIVDEARRAGNCYDDR